MADLEFTGERMVPGRVDSDLELEHVSRYEFASHFAAARDVLDLACGAGYGSGLLAVGGARRVVGMDIALDAVAYSRTTVASGPSFLAGDCLRLPFPDDSFDRVVAFEILEHVERPDELLREARRVLRPDGLLVLSTPDRDSYAEARQGQPNPFHVQEFSAGELAELLGSIFAMHRLIAQTRAEGALFTPLDDRQSDGGDVAVRSGVRPDYLIGLCGSERAVEEAAAGPYFHAGTLESIRRRDARIRELQEEVEERSRWGRRLDEETEKAGARIRELQEELDERTVWARSLEEEAARQKHRAAEAGRDLEERSVQVRELEERSRSEREKAELLAAQIRLATQQDEERRSWVAERREWSDRLDRERQEWLQRFMALEERTESIARRTQEVEVEGRQTVGRLDDAERRAAEAMQREAQAVERRFGDLTAKLNRLLSRLEAETERSEWQGESLELHRRSLDEIVAILDPVEAEVSRLTQAEYSHGAALEHLASQGEQLRNRAELAEGGLRHLEQLAGEMQAGLEHTHGLMAQVWRSAAWTAYHGIAGVIHRFVRVPGRRLGDFRETLRRRRAARRERARQVVRLTGELASRSVALPVGEPPQVEILLFATSGEQAVRCLDSLTSTPARTPYRVTLVADDPWFPLAAFRSLAGLRVVRVKADPWQRLGALSKRLPADHVICLDARVRLSAECLDRLVGTFRTFPSAGIVGARVVDDAGRIVEQGGVVGRDGNPMPCRPLPGDEDVGRAREVEYCSGYCVAFDRALIRRLGGLRGDLEGREHRFADLGLRARAEGVGVWVQPTAVVRLSQRLPESGDPRGDVLLGQAWRSVIEPRPPLDDATALLATLDGRPRLLVIDHRLPTPDQDSGSLRMTHVLRLVQELGYRVTFVPANLQLLEPYGRDLEAIGVEVVSAPKDRSVAGYLERTGDVFDVALVSRAHIAEEHLRKVRSSCPSARVLFDTVDLQFLRLERQAELEQDEDLLERAREMKSREIGLARDADLTLVVSEVERSLLATEAPELPVRVLSNIHHVYGAGAPFEDRSGLLFIGGFEHPPNVDAVVWLVEEILPSVHSRLPDVHVSIIGSKPTGDVRRLASEKVTIAGYVRDATPYFERSRLSVAPLRYGAGVKGKVNQSLAHGLPCVATSCAAEGMGLTTGLDILIADDAGSFADAVVKAYSDPTLWRRLSEGGLRNTRERFSVAAARRDLEEILEEVCRPVGDGEGGRSVLVFPPDARNLGS